MGDIRMGQLIVDQLLQPVGSVAFSNDKQCVLVSTLDHNIRLLERDSGDELACYKGHTNQRFKVQSAFGPSDACVVSGSEDHRICFWDLVDGNMICSVKGHGGPVLSMRLFENNLVSGAGDGTIKVWDVNLSDCGQRQVADDVIAGKRVAIGPVTAAVDSLP